MCADLDNLRPPRGAIDEDHVPGFGSIRLPWWVARIADGVCTSAILQTCFQPRSGTFHSLARCNAAR
jgi:hypothetical protein